MRKYLSILVSVILVWCTLPANALEIVVTNPARSQADERNKYPLRILEAALKKTVKKYGPFEIRPYPNPVPRKRALKELLEGRMSVFPSVTQTEWETKAIPVWIPIMKGLLGFKLLLIRNEDQAEFAAVRSVSDLMKFRLGQGQQWSSTAAFKKLGFRVSGGTVYESLFKMLDEKRFDYFPRGVNEIFTEFQDRKTVFLNIRIEETLAIYLPSPVYFFVSPKRPELAVRIEEGLMEMIQDGEFDHIFNNYYAANLKAAMLANRRIIHLKNLNLSKKTPLHLSKLWLNVDAER